MNRTMLAFNKGYRATNDGRVISPLGKVLKLSLSVNGYPQFGIYISKGRCATVKCHRLQGFQKFGDKMLNPVIVVRHKDGNKTNFHSDNLVLGTQSENYSDIPLGQRREMSTKMARAKTKFDPKAILALSRGGASSKEIMARFGIKCHSTLWNILNPRRIREEAA